MNDAWVISFSIFGIDGEQAEELTDVIADMLDFDNLSYTGSTYPLDAE